MTTDPAHAGQRRSRRDGPAVDPPWVGEQLEFAPSVEESPWWERFGFESADAFFDDLREQYARDPLAAAVAGVSVPDPPIPDVADTEIPGASAPEVEREARGRRRARPVGIRLAADDYDLLAEAAHAHGVAPTTLARILTARGARALASRAASPPRSE